LVELLIGSLRKDDGNAFGGFNLILASASDKYTPRIAVLDRRLSHVGIIAKPCSLGLNTSSIDIKIILSSNPKKLPPLQHHEILSKKILDGLDLPRRDKFSHKIHKYENVYSSGG
jgi:hypothetical protein